MCVRVSRAACRRGVCCREQANVRDLWAHADLGVMTSLNVEMPGDGASVVYKLTKA